ncbi:hypothetical protein NKH18_16095 [Streptomyces sp. M10(2022)]
MRTRASAEAYIQVMGISASTQMIMIHCAARRCPRRVRGSRGRADAGHPGHPATRHLRSLRPSQPHGSPVRAGPVEGRDERRAGMVRRPVRAPCHARGRAPGREAEENTRHRCETARQRPPCTIGP